MRSFYFAIDKSAPIQLSKSNMPEFEFNIKKWNPLNSSVFILNMNVGELVLMIVIIYYKFGCYVL